MSDWLIDSKWPPRIMLAATILFWFWGLLDSTMLGFVVALAIITWGMYESKAAERRRTAPERARRSTRELELRLLGEMGAENYLRRILIGDFRQIVAKEKARAYIERELSNREIYDQLTGPRFR